MKRNSGSLSWLIAFAAWIELFTLPVVAQVEPAVQNAILEGLQITTEKGEKPHEIVVTCYFIFIDKPSSYFYEFKRKPNRLIFEFNDTKKGTAPIPSVSQPPIASFEIEETRVDLNKDVKGLVPDWHDVLRIKFNLDAIPQIVVTDEYNVISFKYKWSNDPSKTKAYTQPDNTAKVFLLSSAALATGGGAVAWWYFFGRQKKGEGVEPISIDDLPIRPADPTKP